MRNRFRDASPASEATNVRTAPSCSTEKENSTFFSHFLHQEEIDIIFLSLAYVSPIYCFRSIPPKSRIRQGDGIATSTRVVSNLRCNKIAIQPDRQQHTTLGEEKRSEQPLRSHFFAIHETFLPYARRFAHTAHRIHKTTSGENSYERFAYLLEHG